MEVAVTERSTLPEGAILSIRFGATRRQAPLDTLEVQPMKFPSSLEACPEPLKIDVLQPVGSVRLVPRIDESDYRIGLNTGGASKTMALGLTIKRSEGVPVANDAPRWDDRMAPLLGRYQDAAVSAKDYLELHGVLRYLQALLHAIIQDRPKDPYLFMSEQLRATGKSQHAAPPPPAEPLPAAPAERHATSCPELAAPRRPLPAAAPAIAPPLQPSPQLAQALEQDTAGPGAPAVPPPPAPPAPPPAAALEGRTEQPTPPLAEAPMGEAIKCPVAPKPPGTQRRRSGPNPRTAHLRPASEASAAAEEATLAAQEAQAPEAPALAAVQAPEEVEEAAPRAPEAPVDAVVDAAPAAEEAKPVVPEAPEPLPAQLSPPAEQAPELPTVEAAPALEEAEPAAPKVPAPPAFPKPPMAADAELPLKAPAEDTLQAEDASGTTAEAPRTPPGEPSAELAEAASPSTGAAASHAVMTPRVELSATEEAATADSALEDLPKIPSKFHFAAEPRDGAGTRAAKTMDAMEAETPPPPSRPRGLSRQRSMSEPRLLGASELVKRRLPEEAPPESLREVPEEQSAEDPPASSEVAQPTPVRQPPTPELSSLETAHTPMPTAPEAVPEVVLVQAVPTPAVEEEAPTEAPAEEGAGPARSSHEAEEAAGPSRVPNEVPSAPATPAAEAAAGPRGEVPVWPAAAPTAQPQEAPIPRTHAVPEEAVPASQTPVPVEPEAAEAELARAVPPRTPAPAEVPAVAASAPEPMPEETPTEEAPAVEPPAETTPVELPAAVVPVEEAPSAEAAPEVEATTGMAEAEPPPPEELPPSEVQPPPDAPLPLPPEEASAVEVELEASEPLDDQIDLFGLRRRILESLTDAMEGGRLDAAVDAVMKQTKAAEDAEAAKGGEPGSKLEGQPCSTLTDASTGALHEALAECVSEESRRGSKEGGVGLAREDPPRPRKTVALAGLDLSREELARADLESSTDLGTSVPLDASGDVSQAEAVLTGEHLRSEIRSLLENALDNGTLLPAVQHAMEECQGSSGNGTSQPEPAGAQAPRRTVNELREHVRETFITAYGSGLLEEVLKEAPPAVAPAAAVAEEPALAAAPDVARTEEVPPTAAPTAAAAEEPAPAAAPAAARTEEAPPAEAPAAAAVEEAAPAATPAAALTEEAPPATTVIDDSAPAPVPTVPERPPTEAFPSVSGVEDPTRASPPTKTPHAAEGPTAEAVKAATPEAEAAAAAEEDPARARPPSEVPLAAEGPRAEATAQPPEAEAVVEPLPPPVAPPAPASAEPPSAPTSAEPEPEAAAQPPPEEAVEPLPPPAAPAAPASVGPTPVPLPVEPEAEAAVEPPPPAPMSVGPEAESEVGRAAAVADALDEAVALAATAASATTAAAPEAPAAEEPSEAAKEVHEVQGEVEAATLSAAVAAVEASVKENAFEADQLDAAKEVPAVVALREGQVLVTEDTLVAELRDIQESVGNIQQQSASLRTDVDRLAAEMEELKRSKANNHFSQLVDKEEASTREDARHRRHSS